MLRQKGSLTVEASIALTTFIFFILLFYSFGRVYRAQNLVSHATIQTAEALAVESYFRETVSASDLGAVVSLIGRIVNRGEPDSYLTINYYSLTNHYTDLKKVVKTDFAYAIAATSEQADEVLKKNGVKDGLEGIDFKDTKVDSDIIVKAAYTVELQFPFFGKKELKLTKTAKSYPFKKISGKKAIN